MSRRDGPRRGRGGPPVVSTGSGRSVEERTTKLLQSSDVLSGTWRFAPEQFYDWFARAQASLHEVRPVGPCRLHGEMACAARERDPHGCG
jgi:hypothetical protein